MPDLNLMPVKAHGSWSGYAYWKCRCEPCLSAGTAYREARKTGASNPVPSKTRKRRAKGAPKLDGPVKRYRYRITPSPQAEAQLRRVLGGARFVYNAYIALAQDSYATGQKHPSGNEGRKVIVTAGRRSPDTAWLAELPTAVLNASVLDAARAYENFFASVTGRRKGPRAGHPRFKKRGHRQTASFERSAFSIAGGVDATATSPGGRLRLAKIGTVAVNWHRPLPADPSSVRIIWEADGTWWASFTVTTPITSPTTPTRGARSAGIDLGLTDLAAIVYTDGTREKIENPRHHRSAKKRLAKAQKAYSRTKRGSRNREKARLRVARLHSRVVNQRTTRHRQLAARLTRENQAVAVETLNIRGLGRTRLAAAVHDAGWGQFLSYLDEAAQKRGTTLTHAPAGFPSSRVCAGCGVNAGPKPLHIRTWVCPSCGLALDRDYNAAVNVLVAAGPAETVNACGGSIRRQLAGAAARESGTRPTRPRTRPAEGNRTPSGDQVEAIHSRTQHPELPRA